MEGSTASLAIITSDNDASLMMTPGPAGPLAPGPGSSMGSRMNYGTPVFLQHMQGETPLPNRRVSATPLAGLQMAGNTAVWILEKRTCALRAIALSSMLDKERSYPERKV